MKNVLGRWWCENCQAAIALLVPPPEDDDPSVRAYEYEWHDLAGWDQTKSEKPPVVRVSGTVPLRLHLLDSWAEAERVLVAATVLVEGVSEADREARWGELWRMRVKERIDYTVTAFAAAGKPLPSDFADVMKRLYWLRNMLAHNPERPHQMHGHDAVRVMKPLQFKKAEYVDIKWSELRKITDRADAIMRGVVAAVPEADGSNVQLSEAETARLREMLEEE